jgi:hypothetical protein
MAKNLAEEINGKSLYDLLIKKEKNLKSKSFRVIPNTMLLKKEGNKLSEFKIIPKGNTIQIKNAKKEVFDRLETVLCSYGGFSGYIPINKILAPTFIFALSRVFSGKSSGNSLRSKEVNEKIRVALEDLNTKREQKNLPVKEYLTLKIENEKFEKISFSHSHKVTNDNCAELSFGESPNKQTLFIGKNIDLEGDNNISYFFDVPNSYIYKEPYVSNFLYNVAKQFVKNDTLTISCVRILNPNDLEAQSAFEKSIFGREGVLAHNNRDTINNVSVFADYNDMEFKVSDISAGVVDVKFSGGVVTKKKLREMFNNGEFVLLAKLELGNSILFQRKRISDISMGIYPKGIIKTLRKYVEL